jgi:hypothetical protein
MNSVCVGSPGGRTEGRDSDRGSIFCRPVRNTQSSPSAPASPLSGRTVQSRRKRGVIEVVGDVLFDWVEMPRAHACEPVPDPKVEDRRDAIIKVMACVICGSDFHIFDGMILSYFWGMAALGAKRPFASTEHFVTINTARCVAWCSAHPFPCHTTASMQAQGDCDQGCPETADSGPAGELPSEARAR